MVVNRADGSLEISTFSSITDHLAGGDALVLNDTKVFPARLWAKKSATGARIELLLLRELEKGTWEALVRPGRRVRVGTMLSIEGARQADSVEVVADHGAKKTVKFYIDDIRRLCWRLGEIPLPPYIDRAPVSTDARRYQTVFAKSEGATAAPTAGLHFTSQMLDDVRGRGVLLEYVTLHIGLGTFQPLEHEEVAKNRLHPEEYRVTTKTARRLNEVQRRGGKVLAVGTTTLRVLETIADEKGGYKAGEGSSDIFIYPGHTFRSADALLTNFHLPRSSLLLLVCAFGGHDLIMRSYEKAAKEKFRFYTYGDAMLIL
jgi:S-adenosylmethionine:tRNA ribosyltransferase-isomerase